MPLRPDDLPRLDLADPRLHAESDLTEVWRYLRDEEPAYWHQEPGRESGYWVITRYADVAGIYRDTVRFTSEHGNVLETLLAGADSAAGKMAAVTDGPHHAELRGLMLKAFTPKALAPIVRSVRRVTGRLVEEAVLRGESDFATDVAARVPLAAICDLLDVPDADRAQILRLTSSALASPDGAPTQTDTWTAKSEILLYFAQLAESRRERPGDDLVSLLVRGRVGGRPLTGEEVVLNCYSLILGGDETTRFSMIGGLRGLIERPQAWAAVKSGRAAIETAVEEVLRWTTPTLHAGRTATQDALIHGSFIEAGDKVTVWNVSANRDERQFPDADVFDPARTPNKHLTFAYGPHFCLGSYLARAEIGAALEALRTMVADGAGEGAGIESAGEPRPVYSNFLSGFSSLPVRLRMDPRYRPGTWAAQSDQASSETSAGSGCPVAH
ncbi:cytochrome P450 [Actinocrinis puniceicyclus]|uniref:Cytochrome P450 n=1 Tax=Actinocrinis puniceicyclus TaxID=977794 RepID=A0A8J8BEA7_9ACTN|nr:cytochrome P450 [Actinocrinis puniceicyclus]